MHQITVIGAGFAGLTAARRLRQKDPRARITLVAPAPELVYLPSLIWIPSRMRRVDDLRVDLERFLQRHDIAFRHGRVAGIGEGGREVRLADGEVIRNDGLIIAAGGRFIKKLPGIEHAITICEGIEAAEKIRDRLESMDGGTIAMGFGGNPKEPAAMRGGPMFEVLFGLDTLLRRQGRRDRFKLIFFSPAPRPGQRLGEKAVDRLLREMRRRGIETHLGHKPQEFTEKSVRTEGGEFEADLIIFMPGLTGPAFAADSGLPLSDGGFFRADPHCKVPDSERVYVAGDSGSFSGPEWMPKQAHMADLQAEAAADNLLADLQGRPATATFKTELVCIIDSLDKGILVYRNPQRSLVIPGGVFLHWAKRFFEWWYLRRYR